MHTKNTFSFFQTAMSVRRTVGYTINHARLNRNSAFQYIYALLCIVVLLFSSLCGSVSAAPFTPGNIVIYRVGNGAANLPNTGSPVFLDEYSPTGTLVQSIPMPTANAGANLSLIASGTATSEGQLTRSIDGHYLTLAGYNATIPTTGLTNTSASSVNRTIGRVDWNGDVNTATALQDLADGSNPRGVLTEVGTTFWACGGDGGIRFGSFGQTTSTQLSTTISNIRNIHVFGDQLYVSTASGSIRLGSVGTGLPTTAGQTITNLPGIPTTGSPYDFFITDLSPTEAGNDTLYLTDDTIGLTKYSLQAGTWVSNGTVGTNTDDYRGLTAIVSGNTVTLYATRRGGSTGIGGGELVSLTDASGHNGAFTSTPTLLATAANATAFRGVALAPTALPSQVKTIVYAFDDTSPFAISAASAVTSNDFGFDITASNWSANSPVRQIGVQSGQIRALKSQDTDTHTFTIHIPENVNAKFTGLSFNWGEVGADNAVPTWSISSDVVGGTFTPSTESGADNSSNITNITLGGNFNPVGVGLTNRTVTFTLSDNSQGNNTLSTMYTWFDNVTLTGTASYDPTTTPPAITTEPASQTIPSGSTATLTVTATGTDPLTYQWYQGTTGDTTTPVGTNSASFTTPALTSITSYWVNVSNAANPTGVASTTATVNVQMDVTSPEPNPMTWASPPAAIGTDSITMVATTASDSSGVEYFFQCMTSGGHDSGWQDNPSYTDTGLAAETRYFYRVRTRDKSENQNVTAFSDILSAFLGTESPIPIANSSFETDENTDPGGLFASGVRTMFPGSQLTGWISKSGIPSDVSVGWRSINAEELDPYPQVGDQESQALSLTSGASVHNLTSTAWSSLNIGDEITLTISLGMRNMLVTTLDWCENTFFGLTAENANFTTIELADTIVNSGVITNNPATGTQFGNGTFTDVSFSHTVQASDLLRTGNIGILIYAQGTGNLDNSYNQSFFDNVRLKIVSGESPPLFTSHPASQTIASGSTATLSVEASGNPLPTFQWYSGNSGDTSNPINGATSATFTTPALTTTTSYWVQASNTSGIPANSQTATVTVTPGVPDWQVVVTGPVSVVHGDEFEYVVTVTNVGTTPLPSTDLFVVRDDGSFGIAAEEFEWLSYQFDGDGNFVFGIPEQGITAGFFETAALAPGESDILRLRMRVPTSATSTAELEALVNFAYALDDSNPANDISSIQTAVIYAPRIASHPVSQSITSGSTATLFVEASGNPEPTYQWYIGNSGDTSNPVDGATSATFTTPALNTTTSYWVRASNTSGPAADSNTAIITMAIGPKLVISEVAAWSSFSSPIGADWFEVTNIGDAAANISGWKMDDGSGSFGSAVVLNGITSIAPGEAVIFLETNDLANTSASFKTLWFGASPVGSLQIGSYTGTGVGLSSSGDGLYLFDSIGSLVTGVRFGFSPTSPLATFDNSSGIGSTTVPGPLISALSAVGINGAFTAVNDPQEIGSPGNIQPLAVGPSITTQPASQTIASGSSTTLSVIASGSPAASFQWYRGDSGDTSNPINGATFSVLTINGLTTTTSYWVRASNASGPAANSITATITVTAPPAIISHPASQTVASGATATLSVVATGSPAPAFQWYRGDSGDETNPVSGATNASYTTPALTSNASYWVKVSNSAGPAVNSNTATVSVNLIVNGSFEQPVVSGRLLSLFSPDSTMPGWVVSAGDIELVTPQEWNSSDGNQSLDTSGANPGTLYQDVSGLIPGATYRLGFDLAGNPVLPSDVNKRLRVTSASVSSDFTFNVTGFSRTNMGWTPTSLTFVAQAATQRIQFQSLNAGDRGPALDNVSLVITDIPLVVIPPAITTQPTASQTIPSGSTTTLTVAATGTAPLTYQWYQGISGTTTTPVGTNSPSFTTPALTTTTNYWVRVSNSEGADDSSTATISIIAPNANLSNLILSSASLSPSFNKFNLAYTSNVPNSTTSLQLIPTAEGNGADIKVNGVTVASGTPSNSINLNVGGNFIEVVVTAPDLVTTKTYSINILRNEPPSIATNPATSVASSSATLNGTVDPNGSAFVYFEYGNTPSYGSFTPAQFLSGNNIVPFQFTLGGLTGNSTIHFRAVASQGGVIYNGFDRSFTTLPTPAIVVTGNPVVTSGIAATLVGAINTQGQQAEVFFEYGTTTAYGNSTTPRIIPAGSGLQDVLEEITGLIPNTFYHVRLVASSPTTVEGNDVLFQQKVVAGSGTGSPTAVPSVTTGGVVDVQDDSVTLKGTVNANGGTTTAYFQYGTTPSYGQVSEIQPIGNDTEDAEVSIPTGNLLPGTRYYYRLMAENSLGLSTPDAGTFFDTKFAPPAVTTGDAEALTTTSVRVSGTVSANNADTDVEIIYGTNPSSLSDGIATTPALVTGDDQIEVSADLENLLQSVTYYYRVRAVNSGGTTLGTLRTFRVSTLSGLLQIFPDELDPADHEGSLQVNITPGGIGAGWRLAGEQAWRLPSETITGLTSGDRVIEYRSISAYLPPSSETVTVVSSDPTLVLSRTYTASGATGSGALTVNLKPDTIANPSRAVAERAQWRLLGETNSDWKNSGITVSGLPPGNHVVECKPIAGRSTPSAASVVISDGATTSLILTYYEADPAIGDLPVVLDFDPVREDESLPYAYVGQIRSDAGSSTGFVVRPRVVATVAHAVFDDGTLASATGLQWLFQRHRGVHEPAPMIPRGFYTLTGYAAQRTIDNSPGISTPESQHLDAAAMYFAEDAGRSGFSGYLASDLDENEFLLSSELKTLVGYPIENIAADNQNRMHATPPENISFTLPTGTTRTFTTNQIRSTGGGSGGPLCVLASNGKFFPAGIYLGGTQQTIIRAIDSDVATLFGFAEVSGNSVAGGGRGSITSSESSAVGTPSLGSLQVLIEPAGARNAGAGWRISSGSYLTSGAQLNNLAPNTYGIEFPTVSGFQAPATPSVNIVAGELKTVTFTYEIIIPPPVINSAASKTVNKGDDLLYQITATNTPTMFTLSGLLPLGTVFDSETGRITGIAQEAGKFPVVVGVSNLGGTDTRNVEIISLPIISPQTVNAPYLETFEYQIISSEAGEGLLFAATNLPPGLLLNESTGLISGTPTTPGTYASTISVTISGATKSSTLTLEITGTLPEITTQPAASSSIKYGENVVLTIASTGLPTPTVQWYLGNSGDDSQPISGATNATFVSPSLTTSTAYWARVTNLSGSVNSETSAVIVLPSTNANLNFLSLNAATISPSFTPNGTSYTASVPNSVAAIRLTPNTSVPVSTLTVNTIPSPINTQSEPVALVEGANPISILVTAQDGTTTKEYTVTVTRAPAPDVQTLGSDTINDITATVRGSVNPRGNGTVFFEYGPTTAYGSRVGSQQISGTSALPVSAIINGLSGNQDYHYRVALDDGGTPVYGQDMTFRTSPDRPLVVTGNAAGISETGATLIGIVNPRGSQTNVRFEYGTSPDLLDSFTPFQDIGSGIRVVEITAPITGLTDGLVYYFRTVAESVAFAQPVYGEIMQFTAVTSPETGDGLADGPPEVIPGSETATSITIDSAVLEATINPNDGSTLVHFEYGTTTAYGFQSDSFRIGNGTANALVTIPIANLELGKTYFFRAVAENAQDVVRGTGSFFTTSFETPTVTTGEAVAISSRSARVNGTINANGTTRDVYFRYGTDGITFPLSLRAFQQTVNGNLDTPVFVDLVNLDEGVTYFYKLVATDVGEAEGTEGLAVPLNPSVLLGLIRQVPSDLDTSQRGGQVTVHLMPQGTGSWRFSGEQSWRASGETANALTEGDRTIEFRPVTGFIQPPTELITLSDGDPPLVLERNYYESASNGSGSLRVNLFPTTISDAGIAQTNRAQWRLAKDSNTTWKNSGETIEELPAGTYLIESKTVSGFNKPVLTRVNVADNEESSSSITYLEAAAPPANPPVIISFENGQSEPELPYVHVGQIRSASGSHSGFVVKPKVVATVAQAVFDDATLATVTEMQWLLQRNRLTHEPKPLQPRGSYLFVGYEAQRLAENTPGAFSLDSKDLNVAALFFFTDAGRDGFSGFLASDETDNEFLTSNEPKILAGYPIVGIFGIAQGRMHATAPNTSSFTWEQGKTFSNTSIRGLGGMAGGPLCVRHESGAYYPAAIHVGDTNKGYVRAIDRDIIDIFTRAEVSGNGGDNNTDGGITLTSVAGNLNIAQPGSLKVNIQPTDAVALGAAWRIMPESTLRQSGGQKSGLSPGTYKVEMRSISGFNPPTVQTVAVNGGQATTYTFTYTEIPSSTPLEQWRFDNFGTFTNSGEAADDYDFDKDGDTNIDEFTAGTNPKNSSDFFKMNTTVKTGNNFTTTCAGKVGRTYTLLRNTGLSGEWTRLESQGPLAEDITVTLIDSSAPSGRSFYRIEVSAQ